MAFIERLPSNGGQNGEQALRERLLGSPVRLRGVEERDYPSILRWSKDSRVMPHLIGVSLETTDEQFREFYRGVRVHGYVGELSGGGRIVSTGAFIDPDPNDPDTFARLRSAELVRVAVDPFLQNSHYGTKSLILALDQRAFNPDDLNYDKVAAGYIVTTDDQAGYRRIEHILRNTLGFRVIGIRRDEVVREYGDSQVRQDVVLVELDRESWLRRRDKLIREHFPLTPQQRRGFLNSR